MRARTVMGALLLAASTWVALAGEARVPIYEASVISEPGNYVLTRRVSGPGPLISVEASNVSIDLNGYTLEPTSGAGVSVVGFDRVRVHDGFISGGAVGIAFEDVEGAEVERVLITGPSGPGIRALDTTGFSLRASIIRSTGTDGLLVDGSNLVDPPLVDVVDNHFAEIGDMALELRAIGSSLIAENVIAQTTGRAITLEQGRAVTLEDNIVRDTGLLAIALSSSVGCELRGNVVRAAGANGIVLDASSNDNTIERNRVTNAAGNGLQVGGERNVIEHNLLHGNAGFGLLFNANARDNVFRANSARGNTGGLCASGSADLCDEGIGNTSAGDNFGPDLL